MRARTLLMPALLGACSFGGFTQTPPEPTPYVVTLPADILPMPVPEDNPLTEEGVYLGKHLFYDVILSGNRTQSCGSCHHQENAFAEPKKVSVGSQGDVLPRNAMPLFNLAWHDSFFWDGRAKTIEEQVLIPIVSEVELAREMDELLDDLRKHEHYPEMFARAFGREGINATTLSKALAQFVRSLVSFSSPMDRYRELTAPDPAAMRGGQLLSNELPRDVDYGRRDRCDGCHQHKFGVDTSRKTDLMGLFIDKQFRNNGLEPDADKGRQVVTDDAKDFATFKVPTMRNLTVTGPYMHDGRFETLEEVVDHYDTALHKTGTLDPLLATPDGEPVRLGLSDADKQDVLAFLSVFTDEAFLTDPRHSDPFANGTAFKK